MAGCLHVKLIKRSSMLLKVIEGHAVKNGALHFMRITVAILLITIFQACIAADDFMHIMVQGKYLLVGKKLDSQETYHGKVEIIEQSNELIVSRNINGQTTTGGASIEPTLNGDANVLRIYFEEDDINYEETCLVSSDLDNNARISCYLYQPKIPTTRPGLEVLFNDHTAY